MKRRPGAMVWVCIGWLTIVVLAALLAPHLPLHDPNHNFTGRDNAGPGASPSWTHWFGTDQDARDVFSRTVFGARASLMVGFAAVACGLLVGGTLGILAGFFRGWCDRLISFAFLVLLSFPSLVLAIMITALLDRNLVTISLTLGVLAIAPVGRLARATTLQHSEREYVLIARTIGARNSRLIVRELLPNVVAPMTALALLGMSVAIAAEGALAFLGLSVTKGVTWGKLILLGAGSRSLQRTPWVALAPIVVLFLTVLALNVAGDRLRSRLDVRGTWP